MIKPKKALLLGVIVFLLLVATYTLIWYLRYPVSDTWKTYNDYQTGIELKYPPNLKITPGYNKDYIYISDKNISKPDYFQNPSDIAYEKTYTCPGIYGKCSNVILKGFLLSISKTPISPPDSSLLKDAAYKTNGYTKSSINGHTTYRKNEFITVFPGVEDNITLIFFKGNEKVLIQGYLPLDERMYTKLFDQIISTIRIN